MLLLVVCVVIDFNANALVVNLPTLKCFKVSSMRMDGLIAGPQHV